jgi:hypothetical protein
VQPTYAGNIDAFIAKLVPSQPTLAITSPEDRTSWPAGATVLVIGSASEAVTMNGRPVDAWASSGSFFHQVIVAAGENDYEFTATDPYGQVATARLVLFGTQAQPGAIDFTNFSDVSASFQGGYARTSFNQDSQVLYADLRVANTGQYPADAPLIVGVKNISDPTVHAIGYDGVLSDGTPYFDYTKRMAGTTLAPGGATEYQDLAFFDPNRTQFTYDLVFLGKLNQAPLITSVPVVDAVVGRSYSYAATATDPDGDPLAFSLTTAPTSMHVDASTGKVTWSPTAADLGTHGVTLRVEDGRGGYTTQTSPLKVAA